MKKQRVFGKQSQLLTKFKDTENSFVNVDQSRSTICFKTSLFEELPFA